MLPITRKKFKFILFTDGLYFDNVPCLLHDISSLHFFNCTEAQSENVRTEKML